jgi:S-DNA-T family DNA segregation ATPase FtsK/SpoIIIE
MSDEPELTATQVPPEAIEAAESPTAAKDSPPAPAVYADITAPGERRPVLPAWARSRDAAKHQGKRVAGAAVHTAAYHSVRGPVYLAHAVFWAIPGIVKLTLMWLRWWLFPVPVEVYGDAIADGHRAWHRTAAVHRETTKTRALISLAVLLVIVVSWTAVARYVPWYGWLVAALGVLPVLARYGRPGSIRIVGHATVPPEYEPLTQDVITRALGSLGLAGINQWLREDHQIDYVGPVRQDGPRWRAEMNLPYGVQAVDVIERRGRFASGLRRPLGAVWPEPVTEEHPGRLEVWVGQQDVNKRKPPAWPLLKAAAVDVFAPIPFATDMRGRVVKAPLIFNNWLIGSMPRQGKTVTVRGLCCAVALDPIAEQWIHELKGTGDLDPLECVAHRFVSGIDDPSIEYAAESLAKLRREVERRSPEVKALPPELCPDRKVTRQISKRFRRLRPIICTIDECQNLFAHPRYGKKAGADAEFIIKVGPALGICLILATQRPDKDSLPTGVSGNVSIRFCLYVAGQVENDMILGTSAYKNGIRATLFRPEVDAGLGYLKGATPAPQVVRTYGHDVKDAKVVAARARTARERAGTLTGVALGEDTAEAARDPLADAAAVFDGARSLHWTVLAERLAQRWPDRWAGATAESVSAELRALGVPSVTVSAGGVKARGARLAAIEAAAASDVTPRSEA